MRVRKAFLFVKRTAFERYQKGRSAGDQRMRRLLERGHRSVARIGPAHEDHLASLRLVRRELRARGIAITERRALPKAGVRGFDLVVSVGGDGTLLESSHGILDRTPVLGVNSAPAFSVGFLTGCRAPTFAQTLDDLLADRLPPAEVVRLRVSIGRRTLREPVLNDVLFCADNPAVTTRYHLTWGDEQELQRSSGLWVATPAGSTAAFRSAGGQPLALHRTAFAFVVREAYAPPGAQVRIQRGELESSEVLTVECRIDGASVFLDGSHRRRPVPFGEKLRIALSPRTLRLVRRDL